MLFGLGLTGIFLVYVYVWYSVENGVSVVILLLISNYGFGGVNYVDLKLN